MHEWTSRLAGDFVSANEELEREFDARLVESARLAFRVAFSVLRHREDAEDVAQDAFAKAHRHFRQLRDPERFERWLVRMIWRMALDRRRSEEHTSELQSPCNLVCRLLLEKKKKKKKRL